MFDRIHTAFLMAPLLLLFSVTSLGCAANDPNNNTDHLNQNECQAFCEEENAEDLADTENCSACAVTCEIAEDNTSYTCVWEECNAERCAAQCEGTEFPLGLCNQNVDGLIYWGCNCFAQG